MDSRTTELKVGILVLVGLVLLGYMTTQVGRWSWGREEGYVIDARLTSAAGLDRLAPVRMAGVTVGKVEQIQLEGTRARVRLRIAPDVEIPVGTRVSVRSSGMLGDRYVELVPGKGPGFLEDGALIGEAPSTGDLDQLMAQMGEVAREVQQIARSLREILTSPKNRRALEATLENLQAMTTRLREVLEQDQQLVEESLARIRDLFRDLQETVSQSRPALQRTLTHLEGFSQTLETDGTRLIQDLGRITRRIDQGEGTLGRLVTDASLYERVDRTLTEIDDLLTRAQRLILRVGFRGEYQLAHTQTKGYFSIQIEPRPRKYYLLEVIDDPRGRLRVTETQTFTSPPGETVTTREVVRTEGLKFSAQFARQFGPWVFRGGLMENTFGIGLDYMGLGPKFLFSLEAWDWEGDEDRPNPHLKVRSRYRFFRGLFVEAGWDDFANARTDSAFLGGGLSFTDEDLKLLFSRIPIAIR